MNHIEEWWRHNGCYDREQVSGIPYDGQDAGNYLNKTDKWWNNLSDEQKENIYDDFFRDC